MNEKNVEELCDLISRSFPEIAFWVPIIKPRILKDKKFMTELEQWIQKTAKSNSPT
jgi:hypothetical protein